jgi:hypothetical protein
MVEATPQNTFLGLPLSSEQDAEVRHYIKRKRLRGAPWDTSELKAMLDDMLVPPREEDGDPAPLSTRPGQPQNARQLPLTRLWNPLGQARSEMRPWKPKE